MMMAAAEPVRAPALTGLGWLNTAASLTWEKLRGKLVVLDFWTYGCINCQHVLAELRAIEARYADEPLVVLGIHSAKFGNEQDIAHVREAIGRSAIHHPVLVDDHRKLWDAFCVRGWPTLVLVDPRGYVLGSLAGEGHGQRLSNAIGAALQVMRDQGTANDAPLPVRLEATTQPATALRYPGKLLADPTHDRLFIADSGYQRIVVTTRAGKLLDVVGSGDAGASDGGWEEARFNNPQGLALTADGHHLFVADTDNHLIRSVDLAARTVTTIAGTGTQNRQRFATGPALATALNSPWDLALTDDTLWIAMAGQHQLWRLDRATGVITVAAGSGAEGRLDAVGRTAAFAQPSGLALTADAATLYVADSEISCVRAVDLATARPVVTTVAGGDLFDFGLRDGDGDNARFQHPLGVAWNADKLYVADTYNHAIRQIDLAANRVTTFVGDGEAGRVDGIGNAARFYEPGGIAAANEVLYVADTNNHAIRQIAVATGMVTTLKLPGVCAPGFCLPDDDDKSSATH